MTDYPLTDLERLSVVYSRLMCAGAPELLLNRIVVLMEAAVTPFQSGVRDGA